MRTSTLLFFGAFLAMFAFDFLFHYLPKVEFKADGIEHPYVQKVMTDLNTPIDATSSPIEERRFSIGYLMRATVMPGIRLVHDPAMGKEIIAKGPAAALDVLGFEAKGGRLVPDFTKLVKLNELIEVRVNLEAHGSEHMRITLYRSPTRNTLNSEFTTAGPLTFRFLELHNAGTNRIDVQVENLLIWSHNTTDNIFGTAERLEVLNSDKTRAEIMLPNLTASEIILTEITEDVKGPPPSTAIEAPQDSMQTDSLPTVEKIKLQ
jgi:hypothetical protein